MTLTEPLAAALNRAYARSKLTALIGSVILLLVGRFEWWTALHRADIGFRANPLVRLPIYVLVLPLMVYLYWYRPLKTMRLLRRVLQHVEEGNGTTVAATLLIGQRVCQVQCPEGTPVKLAIYAQSYMAKVFLQQKKQLFFPLAAL